MTGSVTTVELWDGRSWPGRMERGIPTFQFRCAPQGLLTRRQLRAAGLAPGGQEPWAQLVWRRDRRFAWLYRVDLATPKRTPTPAQLAAVEAALAARRVCTICGPVTPSALPTSSAATATPPSNPSAKPADRFQDQFQHQFQDQ